MMDDGIEEWDIPEGEGTSSLDGAAVALHEVYQAFLRAGFSETQAFALVKTQWQTTISLP